MSVLDPASDRSRLTSLHLVQMMSDLFRRELKKFDSERVLPAWDGLVTKQQTTLESLGVPAMYVTVALADREVCTRERS